jgi:hypothetical protein
MQKARGAPRSRSGSLTARLLVTQEKARSTVEEPDHRNRRLLSARREWPSRRRA